MAYVLDFFFAGNVQLLSFMFKPDSHPREVLAPELLLTDRLRISKAPLNFILPRLGRGSDIIWMKHGSQLSQLSNEAQYLVKLPPSGLTTPIRQPAG